MNIKDAIPQRRIPIRTRMKMEIQRSQDTIARCQRVLEILDSNKEVEEEIEEIEAQLNGEKTGDEQ